MRRAGVPIVLALLAAAVTAAALAPAAARADDEDAADSPDPRHTWLPGAGRPVDRTSSVALTATSGQGGYGALLGEFGIGIDPAWELKASVDHVHSAPDSDSNEVRLGADQEASDSFSWSFVLIGRGDPGGILSKGLGLTLDWDLSSLWSRDKEALKTTLSGGVEGLNYQVSSTASVSSRAELKAAIAGRKLVQRKWTAGLAQELSRALSLSFTYDKYLYDKNPEELDAFLSKRSVALPGLPGLITGFADHDSTLELTWESNDTWTFSTSGGTSESAVTVGQKTSSVGVSAEYHTSANWTFKVSPSGSRTDGQKDAGLVAFKAEYEW
jgi:hypothetical protein